MQQKKLRPVRNSTISVTGVAHFQSVPHLVNETAITPKRINEI
jgi:hypothetical protein